MEDGEEGEVDDHGITVSIRRVRNVFCIFNCFDVNEKGSERSCCHSLFTLLKFSR